MNEAPHLYEACFWEALKQDVAGFHLQAVEDRPDTLLGILLIQLFPAEPRQLRICSFMACSDTHGSGYKKQRTFQVHPPILSALAPGGTANLA